MGNQRRVVTLLRWVMFVALAYLTSAGAENTTLLQLGLLAVVAVSNIVLGQLKESLWEHPALLPVIALLDIGVLTSSMLWGQGFARDFFFAYFVLLAVVAMMGSLRFSIAGTAVVATAYGTYLVLQVGAAVFHSPELISRLGFLFAVGVGYGGLMEAGRVRLRESAMQGQLIGWVGKLSTTFSDDFDAAEVIRQVLIDLQGVMPGNVRVSLVQINEDSIQVISSSDDQEIRDRPLAAERYPELQCVIGKREPVLINDIRTSPITESVRDLVQDLPFTSLLLCPVSLEGPEMGHVVLRVARRTGSFSPGLVATTQNVAEAIGVIFRQAKLREAMERSEKMQMVSQVTSSVAHSFNGILSTVLLAAEVLRKQALEHAQTASCGTAPCDQEAMDRFESIELAVKEGLTIVERLNAWTRLGADSSQRQQAHRTSLDAAALLEEAWRYAQPHWTRRAATRDLELAWNVGKTPPVHGSAAELREVLLNLIVNAIDAMPKGGTLTLGLRSHDERVFFAIEDTGIWIAQDNLKRIFEPLFSTKGSAGTGLGLSVARSVAQRHDGMLTVTSEEGVGSCFRLTLPVAVIDEENAAASGDSDAEAGVAGQRVLLVEANELVRDVMLRFLQSSDLVVDVVSSTDEAKVMLGTSRSYAGIVIDAGLAGGNAASFLDAVSSGRPDLEGRVLFYWTHELTPEMRDLQRVHGFGFVNRSAGLEALREALEAITTWRPDSSEAAA